MHISLVQKLVFGALAAAGAALAVPSVLDWLHVSTSLLLRSALGLAASGAVAYAFARRALGDHSPAFVLLGRAARGELTPADPLAAVLVPDESHELARGATALYEKLRVLSHATLATGEQLERAVASLGGSANGADGAAREIAETISEIAKGGAQQRGLLADVQRLSGEIASAIEANAERAREAFGFAAEANQKANSGVDISRLAIEKMRSVFERMDNAGKMVFDLEAKTRHVHQITELITSVASRTNLLSLNASIEAARAGEAGRGFAVVADEIRKLAESAQRSADEISKLVGEIESETRSVADEMRESGQVIAEGRDDVNTIAHSLGQIRAAVGEASSRAEKIFEQADVQAQGAERMVAAMSEVTSVSAANFDSVDLVAGAAQRQLESTAGIVSGAQSLGVLARALLEVEARVRTREASPQ